MTETQQHALTTRRLGRSDLEITTVGFGAWAIGGGGWEFGWGPQDDAASIAAIHRALERGINWIDTAAVYGLGHSEEVVAKALAGRAERPYVFTKCAMVWDAKGVVRKEYAPDSIRREIEASLRRLQVETIDLYQIHWPPPNPTDIAEIDGAMEAIVEAQRAGKIRHIGVSNFNVAEIKRAQAIGAVTSLQPPYSLLNRGIEAEMLPYCQSQHIGVIVYSPMASGLLSGAMTKDRVQHLPADDWRRRDRRFQEPRLSRNLALVEVLRAVGARHGRSAGEVAIAWTLHHPAVTAAIVGARSPEQIDGIVGAGTFRLTDDEVREIERAVPA
ncbi:MAG TPA: aldo/keto reductase [Gemmatimonadaceae bacterium]|jgi:aryl-alcohol dehydrogenase-like predicted oxidoreductase|nr:aldo/keto reductase [Gemmatimonadaceae bacterium]